ncbi:unnamed protein product [Paramecium octaurelia]|uniref:Cyclic nucleotide-binding domain-containing protein n=1 Tax=Paramecium octaurelia TaxID=43137 RepID=A0A8S1TQ43_PAROT|nr:unnamed protein product [Paramecium octaurelia]
MQTQKCKLQYINPQIQNIQCKMVLCKANSVVFQQGEVGKNLYHVLCGQLTCLFKEEDCTPSKQKFMRQQSNDIFVQQVLQLVPNITILSKQYFQSNQNIPFAQLYPGDTFGEAKVKRSYTVIAEKDSIMIELQFDEKYWRSFESRHSFLEKLNVASDLQLLSVCLKEKQYKYGDYIFKQEDQRKWIYMIISGEVNFINNNTNIYNLGALQIFGFEEFLRDSLRKYTVKCISAQFCCYVVDSLNYFNIMQLEKLAKARNLMIQQILRQKKQVSITNRQIQMPQVSKGCVSQQQQTSNSEEKNSFYNLYWSKDLSELPRWNLEQLTRDAGASPGQGIIKSKQYKTPILDQLQDGSLMNSRRNSIKPCSVFDVNPVQNGKLIRSYIKRMRAEKYSEYHACLKGNWDLFNVSKVSQQYSAPKKQQTSVPNTQSYSKRQQALKSNLTQMNSIYVEDFSNSPVKIISDQQRPKIEKQSKEMSTMTIHPFKI